MKTFEELGVSEGIRRAIEEMGFVQPMPVQEEVIPYLLGNRNDVIALAQTGTGKTAAFGIPVLQRIDTKDNTTQALILSPTRELCLQIADDLRDFAKYMDDIHIEAVYGGASIEQQIRALRKGAQIIVATPGRLIDLMNRGVAKLDNVHNVVLDEADEMLNMGFSESIDAILEGIPEDRNTLLFSATMSKEIERIAKGYLHDYKEIVVGSRNEGAEHVNHIFENFYQVDVHHAGSGIGLALVKAFAEMHKGNVLVESRQSVGTTFTIQMPMHQEGELEEDLQRNFAMDTLKEGAVMEADQQSLRTYLPELEKTDKEVVLIIDDNQDVRDYVKMLLGEEYLVIEAANGQEGLKMALKYVPDAIICDVMMPIMDGMQCCRHLKSEPQTSHIPVMMLTAYAMDEQKIQGYECGADSYISKPFSAQLLKVRLRNLLDNHLRLKNFFTDDSSAGEKEVIGSMEQDFVDKLRSLINSNLRNSKLNIDDLSDQMGFSRVQFYRKTKSLTGYAPNELVRITRLKLSHKLLTTTDKNVSEIAYEVGFSSPSYFSKCYKEHFGESPLDIQKKLGKK